MKTYKVAVTGGRDHQISPEESAHLEEILLGSDRGAVSYLGGA